MSGPSSGAGRCIPLTVHVQAEFNGRERCKSSSSPASSRAIAPLRSVIQPEPASCARLSMYAVRRLPIFPTYRIQSTDGYPLHELPYSSFILVEPTMMTRGIYQRALEQDTVLLRAIEVARGRKDIWPSRAAAREWFSKRLPWRRWDARVIDLYVVRVLLQLPLPSVVLNWCRNTRCATYRRPPTLTARRASRSQPREFKRYPATVVTKTASRVWRDWSSFARLYRCTPSLRATTIWCTSLDLSAVRVPLKSDCSCNRPEETTQAIVSESAGCRMKSITTVADAGHLVVQENPRGLALAIWGILHIDYAPIASRL